MIPLIYGIGDGRYTSCVSDHAYKRRGITELLYNVGSCSLAEGADDAADPIRAENSLRHVAFRGKPRHQPLVCLRALIIHPAHLARAGYAAHPADGGRGSPASPGARRSPAHRESGYACLRFFPCSCLRSDSFPSLSSFARSSLICGVFSPPYFCLLYTSDAADDSLRVRIASSQKNCKIALLFLKCRAIITSADY